MEMHNGNRKVQMYNGNYIVEMHNGNYRVEIAKQKCIMHSGNCIVKFTFNFIYNWIYVIFDMFYYNVK